MYSVGENDRRFPILVTGDAVHPIQKEARRETWVSVSLTFDPKDGNITVLYDSTQINVNYPALIGAQEIRIAFGYCPFEDFVLDDVASVNLKDISLKRGNQEIRLWKMARHNGDICYDEHLISPLPARIHSGLSTNTLLGRKSIHNILPPLLPLRSIPLSPRSI